MTGDREYICEEHTREDDRGSPSNNGVGRRSESGGPGPALDETVYSDPYLLIGALNEGGYRIYRRDGYRIWLNVSESRQMAKRAVGRYEPQKFRLLEQNLPMDGVFFDIGGNKGDFALYAAGRVGANGLVFAVEPHPENANWIIRSRDLNGFSNLSVMEIALSNTCGAASLAIGLASGHHTLESTDDDRDTIAIETKTLDAVMTDLPLDRLDVVKIDVEGAEDRVIAGGYDTLRRFKPMILIDIHAIGGDRLRKMEAMLARLGYDILTAGDERPAELEAGEDYVCRPRSAAPA